ncbi:MAG: hypothetical protein AABZ74_11750 [Cyanobacteriota bacterium]
MIKKILLNIEKEPYRVIELKLLLNKGYLFEIKESYIKGKNINKKILEFNSSDLAEKFYEDKLNELKKMNFFTTELSYLKSLKITKKMDFILIEDIDYGIYYTSKYIPDLNLWILITLKDFEEDDIENINKKLNYLFSNSFDLKIELVKGFFKTHKKWVNETAVTVINNSNGNKLNESFDNYIYNLKSKKPNFMKYFKDENEALSFYKDLQLSDIEENKKLIEEQSLINKAKKIKDKLLVWDKYMKLETIIIFNDKDYDEFGDIGFSYDYEYSTHGLILTTKNGKFNDHYPTGIVF